MKKLTIQSLLIFCLPILISCKKEHPNPELMDPIYKDLVKERKEHEKVVKEEKESIKTLEEELSKAVPRSLEKKIISRDLKKAKNRYYKHKQLLKYFEIRSERRRVEARRDYRIAFENDEPWPDPEEYEHYKTYKRLREANLNWNSRVPKLHERNPNYKGD